MNFEIEIDVRGRSPVLRFRQKNHSSQKGRLGYLALNDDDDDELVGGDPFEYFRNSK